jgi:hypothetical protein
MGATACRPFRVIRVDIAESAFSSALDNTRHHPTESWSADRIMGSKSVLLRTLVAASSAKTAGFACPVLYRNGAPTRFERAAFA